MADNDSRAGKRYDDDEIRRYLEGVHARHDAALEAAFAAPGEHGLPAIMVAPLEARTLELLVRLARAERVVEVGALAGYSAIRLAAGLAPGGKLWTIEHDPTTADIARANLAKAGLADRVEVRVGAGVDVLPELAQHGPFDVVFVDADKQSYHHYGRWAAANLRQGGLLIGDNALLFGQLMEDSDRGAAMRAFHEEAAAAFHSTCIPTPDGLLLGIKK